MNTQHSTYRSWFCHHLIDFVLMPVSILSSVLSLARRVHRFVQHNLFRPSYAPSPQNQARIDAFMAKFMPSKPTEDAPEQLPITNLPNPMIPLSQLVTEITMTALAGPVAKIAPQLSNEYTSALTKQMTAFTVSYLETIIENCEFSELLNPSLDYLFSETQAHEKAQLFNGEKEKIENCKAEVAHPYNSRNAETAQKYLDDLSTKGSIIYQAGLYSAEYRNQRALGGCDEEAKKLAKETESHWAKGLDEMLEADPTWHDKFIDAYLEQCYLSTFIEQPVCTDTVRELMQKDRPNLLDYLEHIASDITIKMVKYCQPALQKMVDDCIIGTALAANLDDHILIPILQPKIVELLKKMVLPDEMETFLVKNLYPFAIQGLFTSFCKTLVELEWDQLGPLLYIYIVRPAERNDVSERVKEVLWGQMKPDLGITKEQFNVIIDQIMPQLTDVQFFVQILLKKTNEQDKLWHLAYFFKCFITEGEKIKRDAEIKQIKTEFYALIPNEFKLQGLSEEEEANQVHLFTNQLDLIIDQIEKHLMFLGETEVGYEVDTVKEELKKFAKPQTNDPNQRFSAVAFEIFRLTNFAPFLLKVVEGNWLSFIASKFSTNVSEKLNIAEMIDTNATVFIKPFLSPEGVLQSIQKGLYTKFLNSNGEIDKEKIDAMLLGQNENPFKDYNLEEEFTLIAKLIFDLAMRQSPIEKPVTWILGDDHTPLCNLLKKVHGVFFRNPIVNLNRVERLAAIIFPQLDHAVEVAREKINASVIPTDDNDKGKDKVKTG